MTDNTTGQPSHMKASSPPSNPQNSQQRIRSKNDIIGRTQLLLASLPGMGPPASISPSGEQKRSPIVSGNAEQKEITSPGILPESREPGLHLGGIFKNDVDAHANSSFFTSATETEMPVLTNQYPEKAEIQAGSLPAEKKAQVTPPTSRRRHWRFLFLLLLVLCVLTLGTFAYAHVHTSSGNKAPIAGKKITQAGKKIEVAEKAMPLQVQIQQQQPGETSAPGNRSLQVGNKPSLTIQGESGNVNIHSGKDGTIFIHSSTDGKDQGANTTIDQAHLQNGHDNVTITSKPTGKPVSYDVTVPTGTQIHVIVTSGLISVAGVSGVTIKTTNGNLTVENINGPVQVHTVNGDITMHHISGQMSMDTTNGSIRADTLSGQLQATTQNGDIIMQQARINGQSALKTRYGSIRFTGALDPQGNYLLKTQSGDIVLGLPANSVFRLYATTGSGSVSNAFGGNSIGNGNAPQAQISASTGSGSVRVNRDGA